MTEIDLHLNRSSSPSFPSKYTYKVRLFGTFPVPETCHILKKSIKC